MTTSRWLRGACLPVALALVAMAGTARAVDRIAQDGFEDPYQYLASDAEAARFLNQATFGATASGIATLRASATRDWIAQQAALSPTLARPFLEALAVSENLAGNSLRSTHRIHRWFDTAVTANDQLRQKVAYALGQMIVVSDQSSSLFDEVIQVAEWNDLLVRNALGNFRTLLGEVARSPAMGRYLTYLRNRKFELTPRCYDQRPDGNGQFDQNAGGDPPYHSCDGNDATNNGTQAPTIAVYTLPDSGLVAPDENFAREVMQLFTIGLIERNLDFSPRPDAANPQPTYQQRTITELARVLTGFGYACSGNRSVAGQTLSRSCNCSGADCNYSTSAFFGRPQAYTLNGQSGLVHPDLYEPMVCYPRYHDSGRDRRGFQLPGESGSAPAGAQISLAAGVVIPAGTPTADKVLELGGMPMLTLSEVSAGEASGRLATGTALDCDAASTPEDRVACATMLAVFGSRNSRSSGS